MNAHAAALDAGRTTAIVFDYAHTLSASVWFGGLILLGGVLIRALRGQIDRRAVLAQALPRFSAMALVCWGLLAITGLYAWWLQVGSWAALRETQYGQSLLFKLILVGIVFLIAGLNLLVITRKLARVDAMAQPRWFGRLGYAVLAELVLTTLLLLAVGRMTSLQPARCAGGRAIRPDGAIRSRGARCHPADRARRSRPESLSGHHSGRSGAGWHGGAHPLHLYR
ncbi:MAG: CopD family protein [Thermomicrobiales bacterium]